jgi:hypothetical protein
MKTKNAVILLLLPLLAGMAGCRKEEAVEPEPPRTVLVYMAADNSLSRFGYENIDSLIAGAAGNHLNGGNLLVYFDPSDGAPQLFQIKKDADGMVKKFPVKDYPEQNSASPDVMRSVIRDVTGNPGFQASGYGLVLWSHGTAWLPYDWKDRLRSFGQDGTDWMEIDGLVAAIPDGVFDFILFDACYMANVEVAYALRRKAGYIVASPVEIIGNGFPYHRIIEPVFRETAELEDVCNHFFDYYNQQTGLYQSASIAVIRTASLDELAETCRAILQGREDELYALPSHDIQSMDYLDGNRHFLYDFDDVISRLASPAAYNAFQNALSKVVVYRKTTPKVTYGLNGGISADMKRFCGISVYLPREAYGELNEWYAGLEWYGDVCKP